jgi:hypothetical protein
MIMSDLCMLKCHTFLLLCLKNKRNMPKNNRKKRTGIITDKETE